MMGMGAALSPEQHERVKEHIAKRQEEIKQYRIENGFEQPEEHDDHDGHDHEHHAGCGCGGDYIHEPEPDLSFGDDEVDEEAILNYIHSRKEVLDNARRLVKSQHAEIVHLKNQLKISEKKVSALQVALGKMREELKTAKAAVPAAAPADDAPATEEPVQA